MITQFKYMCACSLLAAMIFPLRSHPSGPQTTAAKAATTAGALANVAPPASRKSQESTSLERGGQHDFDFGIGTWKVHLSRLLHPLTGSQTWMEYEGTSVVRKVWGGRANLAELEVASPAAHAHIEGLSLRLYNPQSHQWSVYFANSRDGILGSPMIGQFKNGGGEFFDQEEFDGRAIYVRFVFSDITPTSFRFVQSFSADGARTWEPNWIATFTREKRASAETEAQPTRTAEAGQHGFDFELGTWKMRLRRLQHPFTGSHSWVDFDATSVTRKVWGGRAELEVFEANSPSGHIEGLTLRLFDPQSHQWRLYWANGKDGLLGPPQIGQFRNGRGEFFGQDLFQGRAIFIRFVWWAKSAHFEQSFSDDGGKTWEVNWITNQTRVNGEPGKAR